MESNIRRDGQATHRAEDRVTRFENIDARRDVVLDELREDTRIAREELVKVLDCLFGFLDKL